MGKLPGRPDSQLIENGELKIENEKSLMVRFFERESMSGGIINLKS